MDIINGHIMAMTSIGIAELKNNLSKYLRRVRRGESVLVRDRDRVVARLTPASDPAGQGTEAARIAELENTGVLRAPVRRLPRDWLNRRLPLTIDLVGAVLSERAEGER